MQASLRKESFKMSHNIKKGYEKLIGSSQEAKSIKQVNMLNHRAKIDAMAMNALGVEQANQISHDIETLLDTVEQMSPKIRSPTKQTQFSEVNANPTGSQ